MILSRYQYFGLGILLAVFVLATPARAATSLESTRLYLDNLNAQIKTLVEKVRSGSGTEQETTKVALRTVLTDRKNEMLVLARQSPRLFLTLVMPDSGRAILAPELQVLVEKKSSVRGQLEVIHVDDFKNPEKSHYNYSLIIDRSKYVFYTTEPIPSASGAVMAVSGFQLDTILVAQINQISTITPAPPPDSIGEQKTLILLINFLDSVPPPKTPQQIYDLTFNGQFHNFYQEQSYNQVSFSGDVRGWYTLPRYESVNGACLSSDDMPFGNNMIAQLILDNNINLSQYKRLVMVVHSFCAGSYGTVGRSPVLVGNTNFNLSIAQIGISSGVFSGLDFLSQWMGGDSLGHPFPWTPWDFVLSHEVGHNLGVWHANGLDCGENVLRGNCQHFEYGNYFDAMGKGYYSLHFNSLYKELLGWIQPSETIQINSSGRYTLNPLELSTSNKKLAKIQSPLSTSTTLYLEYRRGIGFDEELNDPTDSKLFPNQNGLFINQVIYPSPIKPYTFSRLLDMQPTTESWHNDVPLVAFNSTTSKFIDIESGINLGPIVSNNNSSITFDIELLEPQCVRGNPSINVFSFTPTVAAGWSGSIYVNYSNNDSISCGSSNFKVATNLPANWQSIISPDGDISVFPDSDMTTNISYIIPVGTPVGPYSITVDVINLVTNYKISKTFSFQIINPPTISSISPSSGPIGTMVAISGNNFSSSPQLFFFPVLDLPISSISLDGNTINFTVPREFSDLNCQCLTPILPGVYTIIVYANGAMSNPVGFEVTSASTKSSITVISPNGGEQWAKGSTQNIVWETSNGTGAETYDLTLRDYGGKNTYPITSAVSGQSYAWSVGWQAGRLALVPDGLYYLRVCLSGNDQVRCDESDRPFSIVSGTIKDGGGGPVKQREILPDQDLTASVFSFFRNLFPILFKH